jgi:hypothetical protein
MRMIWDFVHSSLSMVFHAQVIATTMARINISSVFCDQKESRT